MKAVTTEWIKIAQDCCQKLLCDCASLILAGQVKTVKGSTKRFVARRGSIISQTASMNIDSDWWIQITHIHREEREKCLLAFLSKAILLEIVVLVWIQGFSIWHTHKKPKWLMNFVELFYWRTSHMLSFVLFVLLSTSHCYCLSKKML